MTLLFTLLLQAYAENVVIDQETNAAGYLQPNVVTWFAGHVAPPRALTTGAYVFARHADDLLMGLHRTRGWDVPGGHLDPGETAEFAAAREAREETGARVEQLRQIAVQRIHLYGRKPDDFAYPHPVSYQVFFTGTVVDVGTFVEEEDMIAAKFFPCAEALDLLPWMRRRNGLRDHVRAQLARKRRG